MLSLSQQAQIDAPVEVIWELVGDPNRHVEWWPTMLETECPDLEQGCTYRGVVKNPFGRREDHEFVLDCLDACREISIQCPETGVFTRFVLTEAQGGTFVDAEFGAEPKGVGMKVFGAVAGRRYLRRWLAQSLEGLRSAAGRGEAVH
jgi:uncharacterized protein YndB with AHSA1/START domain